jgi:CheY-like chemotaxis protein
MPEGAAMIYPSRILIVDDEPFNVDYLEQELEDLGYTTVSARNGEEALEHVRVEAPDLILLDVMMPIMDGFAVCQALDEVVEICRVLAPAKATHEGARKEVRRLPVAAWINTRQ